MPENSKLNTKATELREAIETLLGAAGLKSELVVRQDDGCDPTVEFDGTGIGVVVSFEACDWSIRANDSKYLSLSEEHVFYTAYASESYPGVRYYSDGSGDPPGEDLIDLCDPTQNMNKAVREAIKALVHQRIDNCLDSYK